MRPSEKEIEILSLPIENPTLTTVASIVVGVDCYDKYGIPDVENTVCQRSWLPPVVFTSGVVLTVEEGQKIEKIIRSALRCNKVSIELMCCSWFANKSSGDFVERLVDFINIFANADSLAPGEDGPRVSVRSSDFSNESAIRLIPRLFGKAVWDKVAFTLESDVVGSVDAFVLDTDVFKTGMQDVDLFCETVGRGGKACIHALPGTRRICFNDELGLPEWAKVIIYAQYGDVYGRRQPLMIRLTPPGARVAWSLSVTHFSEISDFSSLYTEDGIAKAQQILDRTLGDGSQAASDFRFEQIRLSQSGGTIDERAKAAARILTRAITLSSP